MGDTVTKAKPVNTKQHRKSNSYKSTSSGSTTWGEGRHNILRRAPPR